VHKTASRSLCRDGKGTTDREEKNRKKMERKLLKKEFTSLRGLA
jgi:hypothetical protein